MDEYVENLLKWLDADYTSKAASLIRGFYNDQLPALEGAIIDLSNTVMKLHDYKACPNRHNDTCEYCLSLKRTGFIRAGIIAKMADERKE